MFPIHPRWYSMEDPTISRGRMKTQESHLSRQPKTKKGKESQKDTMHGFTTLNWNQNLYIYIYIYIFEKHSLYKYI